ncbi:hypothetical protein [Nostoc sp.]|uniref:hypothetical protein n=1 Tax=Nostoc sp. TaxID=1180 RepID=UPI002FFBE8C3
MENNQCPILLYERLRPKRSYAAGFTTTLSTSAQGPMTAVAPLGETPDALYETLRERGLANAPLSPYSPTGILRRASPLLPKGEASAKAEDRTASPMPIPI